MRRIVFAAAIVLLMLPTCSAAQEELWGQTGGEDLIRAAREYGVELDRSVELHDGLGGLLGQLEGHLPEAMKQALKNALAMLVIVVLCAMAQSVQPQPGAGRLNVPVLAGTLAITAVAANDMQAMMGLGRTTISAMQGFSQTLLPVLAACTAATGHVGAAAARQVATAMFCNILITVIDRLLVALVYAYLAAYAAYTAIGDPGLKRIAQLLRWVVTKTLSVLLVAFVAYLTITGTVAGGADAAAVKATKTVIAGLIPVVGRIIADASETILVGAGMVKNTVGVVGLLVVLGVCLVPFVRLAAHYAAYRLCGALSATVADSRLWELIGGIGTAFGLILGMTGSCAVLLLISVVTAIAGIGGG